MYSYKINNYICYYCDVLILFLEIKVDSKRI